MIKKVSQLNFRFNALDTLFVTVHSVRMTVNFVKNLLKSRGRPLTLMGHLKRIIVEVKAEEICLGLGNSDCEGR